MADIFFSYARRDLKLVESLVVALEARGWTVWWDTDVHGGDSWSDAIELELTQAKCVIVAWSIQSAKSEWVREEARIANQARKLVPILLEPMNPPFGFGGVQTVDISGWDGNREAPEFLRLCTAVQRKLDGPAGALPPAPPHTRDKGAPGETPKQAVRKVSKEPLKSDEKPPVKPPGRRAGIGTILAIGISIAGVTFGGLWIKDTLRIEQATKATGMVAAANGYTVYLHTKLPPPDVKELSQRLESFGYRISGRDSDLDNDSGRSPTRSGVDYAATDPDSKNRIFATKAAEIVNGLLGTDLKPRPQSAVSSGNLGIWLPK